MSHHSELCVNLRYLILSTFVIPFQCVINELWGKIPLLDMNRKIGKFFQRLHSISIWFFENIYYPLNAMGWKMSDFEEFLWLLCGKILFSAFSAIWIGFNFSTFTFENVTSIQLGYTEKLPTVAAFLLLDNRFTKHSWTAFIYWYKAYFSIMSLFSWSTRIMCTKLTFLENITISLFLSGQRLY